MEPSLTRTTSFATGKKDVSHCKASFLNFRGAEMPINQLQNQTVKYDKTIESEQRRTKWAVKESKLQNVGRIFLVAM